MLFFHLSDGCKKGISLLIYSAAWGKKVKTPTIKSKSRQTPGVFAVWGLWLCQLGARVPCVACVCHPAAPCWVSLAGSTRWCGAGTLTRTADPAAAVPAHLELGWNGSQELHCSRASHIITLYNLQMCIILSSWVVPPPLKWCIWVFEDGGSRSVQSVLNQPVFEPVISKGLQYYVHINRRMGLSFGHKYKPHAWHAKSVSRKSDHNLRT